MATGTGDEPQALTPAGAAHAALARYASTERFNPGELMGSERALAERLGVGRSVLRQAIERMEAEGTVRRVLGRSGGVFFNDGRIQRHLNTVEGVPQMVLHQGRTISTQVLRTEMGLPQPDERRNLRLNGGDAVLRIQRLRLVDDVSWSLDLSVLPAARFPGLLNHPLTGSLYHLLTAEYGLELDRADETVEAVPATDDQAEVLQVPAGSALLEIRRLSWDVQGAPVEYAHDFFRADRTRVHMQKYGTNWKRTVRLGRG
ncbi:GntR family transcriptional regulator [Arthrobacter sp. AD-310]